MSQASKRTLRIVGASVVLLALVWQRIQATQLGYKVEKARRQTELLRSQIGDLDIQLETFTSPARLATAARERLGMFPAPPAALRILAGESETRPESLLTRLMPRPLRGVLAAAG